MLEVLWPPSAGLVIGSNSAVAGELPLKSFMELVLVCHILPWGVDFGHHVNIQFQSLVFLDDLPLLVPPWWSNAIGILEASSEDPLRLGLELVTAIVFLLAPFSSNQVSNLLSIHHFHSNIPITSMSSSSIPSTSGLVPAPTTRRFTC